jgi:hypothetical protein
VSEYVAEFGSDDARALLALANNDDATARHLLAFSVSTFLPQHATCTTQLSTFGPNGVGVSVVQESATAAYVYNCGPVSYAPTLQFAGANNVLINEDCIPAGQKKFLWWKNGNTAALSVIAVKLC